MNIKILRILVFLMCISLQSVSAISAERKGSSTLILKQSNLELLDVTFHNVFEKDDFVSFKGKIKDTSQNILGNKSLNFAIDFDFQDAKSKTDNIVKFSRIDIKIEQLLDHEVTTKILKCSKISYKADKGVIKSIKILFQEEEKRSCIINALPDTFAVQVKFIAEKLTTLVKNASFDDLKNKKKLNAFINSPVHLNSSIDLFKDLIVTRETQAKTSVISKKLKHRSVMSKPMDYSSQVNIFVPKDVIKNFTSASPQIIEYFCKPDGNYSYERALEIKETIPPWRIKGLTSSMSNQREVGGLSKTMDFVSIMSELAVNIFLTRDEAKHEAALSTLFYWAKEDALKATVICFGPKRQTKECTQYQKKDGSDLSDSMDYGATQSAMMHLTYAYYFSIVMFKPEDNRHAVIQEWLAEFLSRNKKKLNEPAFGFDFGWHFPAIFETKLDGKNPEKLIKKLLKSLNKLILKDGSIKDRTTRGYRALWYHHDAMREIMLTLEIARNFNVAIPETLHKKIEKSAQLFVRGFLDHSYMNQWAKTAHNMKFIKSYQKFDENLSTMRNGTTWIFLYLYRYPNSEIAKTLARLIKHHNQIGARRDGMTGLGLGCLYMAAMDGRRANNPSMSEIDLASMIDEDNGMNDFSFTDAKITYIHEDRKNINYKVKLSNVNITKKSYGDIKFDILIGYKTEQQKKKNRPIGFKFQIWTPNLNGIDKEKLYKNCRSIAYKKKDDKLIGIKMHYGNEEMSNYCLLKSVPESEHLFLKTLHYNLNKVIQIIKISNPVEADFIELGMEFIQG
jgi:hypothetical protein